MIDRLGYVPKVSNLTVEQVKTKATPTIDAPISVETSHVAQEKQLTQAKKNDLAMLGSIQQSLIGAEFDGSQPLTRSSTVVGSGNPELKRLAQRLADLEDQKQKITEELKELQAGLLGAQEAAAEAARTGNIFDFALGLFGSGASNQNSTSSDLSSRMVELQDQLRKIDSEIKQILDDIQRMNSEPDEERRTF